jgi:chromosome partitioning protein
MLVPLLSRQSGGAVQKRMGGPATDRDDLLKIVVLNPKGGCGKTTLATNLASLYAVRGPAPTLVDGDPQGFSTRWLEKRPADRPPIHGIRLDSLDFSAAAPPVPSGHPESSTVIVDLPAAIPHDRLHAFSYLADNVLLPILPSDVDIYSATRLIAELLLDAQLDRREQKLAIVANRVRSTTKSYQMLMRFLGSLRIPLIATLRDSQNFVQASAGGLGVCELPPHKVETERAQLNAIVAWLDKRRLAKQQRRAMIAAEAYRRATQLGFGANDPLENWLEAERAIDNALAKRTTGLERS